MFFMIFAISMFSCWCFFMQTRLIITLINCIAYPVIRKDKAVAKVSLSILIPAKDEESRILPLLNSIAEQDFQNYEVIVLDDNSTDNTYELVREFCKHDSRFSIVKGKSLPAGWKGKNYACAQLAELAVNTYLVFLDADVRVNAGLFNSSLALARKKKLSLLSVFPNQRMVSFGEKITVPIMNYLLLSMMPAPLILISGAPLISTACGQFMLFPRDEYRKYLWHERVRNEVVEDICIAREVKKAGLRQDIVLSENLISCRMYTNLEESIHGFSRSIPFVFNYNIFLAFTFLAFLSYGPVYCLLTGNYINLILISVVIIVMRLIVSFLSGQSAILNIVLHPLQVGMLAYFFIRNFYDRNKQGVSWKGRRVDFT